MNPFPVRCCDRWYQHHQNERKGIVSISERTRHARKHEGELTRGIYSRGQDVCKSIPKFVSAVKGLDQCFCLIYPRQAYRHARLIDDDHIWIRSGDLGDRTGDLSWKSEKWCVSQRNRPSPSKRRRAHSGSGLSIPLLSHLTNFESANPNTNS